MTIPFFILDVFAENKYEGNQLAVFCNAQDLSTAQMQAMAREINFAESTFIMSDTPQNGGYDVRIFTPDVELPFAGHPTLGTSWLIMEQFTDQTTINLNLKVGQIPVKKHPDDNSLWLTAKQPIFRKMAFETDAIASFSGILAQQITEFDHVSTGVPCLVVWLDSVAALGALSFDLAAAKDFFLQNQLYYSHSPEGISSQLYWVVPTSDNTFQTRMSCWENNALVEDAATGSAATCLLAYLLRHKQHTVEVSLRQGVEMGRNARIYLKGQRHNEQYDIKVGGKVIQLAKGEWSI
jgi:trans-2,3-dihydro-3-hydroxyanthranilate isomerase